MIANVLTRLGAVLAALLLAISFAHAAESVVTFTGEVTYRERIALPPDAELRVSLVSLSNPATPIVGATARVMPPGQVPLQFTLNVRSDVVNADRRYGLRAEILSGGAVFFRNAEPVPVDVAAPVPVGILVNLVAEGRPEPPAAELDVSAALFGTVWQVRSIGGTQVIGSTNPTLSIAPDRRASGSGGCNNFFTEARLDGSNLSFALTAGTQMACAPEVMAQERSFFNALQATASYEVTDSTLRLFDRAGGETLRLAR